MGPDEDPFRAPGQNREQLNGIDEVVEYPTGNANVEDVVGLAQRGQKVPQANRERSSRTAQPLPGSERTPIGCSRS